VNLLEDIRLDMVPLRLIDEGERAREEYGDLRELIVSFETEGIIQPIAVKTTLTGYLLLAGGRRFRAMKQMKLEFAPCRIYSANLTKFEEKSIELTENLNRLDLTWLEKIRLEQQIHNLQVAIHGEKTSTSVDAPGWSKRDTAKLLEKSPASIVQDIMLNEAVEKIPELRDCKSKDEARKLLSMMQETLIKAELAKRIEESRGSEPTERIKLCDSFIIGDFFQKVKDVPDSSIDFIEMDSPYAIDLPALRKLEGIQDEAMRDYNEIPVENFPDFTLRTLQQCYRVLAPSGWLVIWFGPEPWFDFVYQTLKQVGFKTRRIPAVWTKPQGQSMQPDIYMSNNYEMFFYARKESGLLKRARSNVFDYTGVNPTKRIHPTERPIEMMQEIISVFAEPGNRILVPFLGSGNTLLAASNMGIQAFGYELSREYKDSFILRVHEGKFGGYKSYERL